MKKLSLVGAAVAGVAMQAAMFEHPEMWKRRLASLTMHPKVPPPIKADVQKAIDEMEAQKRKIIELEATVADLQKGVEEATQVMQKHIDVLTKDGE